MEDSQLVSIKALRFYEDIFNEIVDFLANSCNLCSEVRGVRVCFEFFCSYPKLKEMLVLPFSGWIFCFQPCLQIIFVFRRSGRWYRRRRNSTNTRLHRTLYWPWCWYRWAFDWYWWWWWCNYSLFGRYRFFLIFLDLRRRLIKLFFTESFKCNLELFKIQTGYLFLNCQ